MMTMNYELSTFFESITYQSEIQCSHGMIIRTLYLISEMSPLPQSSRKLTKSNTWTSWLCNVRIIRIQIKDPKPKAKMSQ